MKKILVVEDERSLREAIAEKLKRNDFEVITAPSCAEALKEVKKNLPDAVWLDHYLMGKETGLDFVAKIKTEESTKSIPIYLVSNTASPAKVQTYMQLGVEKYFVKQSAKLDEIIAELKMALGSKE
jgi:CheY-like chemotaxis protein